MPELGYSWRRSSALRTQRALFGLRKCMTVTATQNPLPFPFHLSNLYHLHSPGHGFGGGHTSDLFFYGDFFFYNHRSAQISASLNKDVTLSSTITCKLAAPVVFGFWLELNLWMWGTWENSSSSINTKLQLLSSANRTSCSFTNLALSSDSGKSRLARSFEMLSLSSTFPPVADHRSMCWHFT